MSRILNQSVAHNGQPLASSAARARSSATPQDVSRNLPMAQPLHGNPLMASPKLNHSSVVATGTPPWLHGCTKDLSIPADGNSDIFHNSSSSGEGGSSTGTYQTFVESNNTHVHVQGVEEFAPWSASDFLQSVLSGNKLNSIKDVMGEIDCISLEKHVTLTVTVSSAVKLEKKQIDQITRKMQKLTGFRYLNLKNIIDPSLIAGFVIRYDSDESHVIDLSVRSKLAELAARIETTEQRRAEFELERRFP